MKDTLKAVRAARKTIVKMADDLPDLDAYCMVYCILMNTVEVLDLCLQDLPPAIKEAKKLAKKNPNIPGKTR